MIEGPLFLAVLLGAAIAIGLLVMIVGYLCKVAENTAKYMNKNYPTASTAASNVIGAVGKGAAPVLLLSSTGLFIWQLADCASTGDLHAPEIVDSGTDIFMLFIIMAAVTMLTLMIFQPQAYLMQSDASALDSKQP